MTTKIVKAQQELDLGKYKIVFFPAQHRQQQHQQSTLIWQHLIMQIRSCE